jgi:protein-tyrosine phosphatase
MDRENYEALAALCPPGQAGKLRMLMDYAPDMGARDVPDPYYGSAAWFDRVVDLIDAAAEGLFIELQRRRLQGPDI